MLLRERHRDWYLGLAERAEAGLRGADQARWLERLEQDHDDLRAALGWCGEREEAEAGLRLSGALWWVWHLRGHLRGGRDRLAAGPPPPGAAVPTPGPGPARPGA